ncbi:helix-turn-helix domain-containing protein [Enterococcus nangangensis]|uniref:helix-turn-helix domain-containing protein n=1 Tax=Enterococcus nangangensis TaxID=2559926 RepID=UPI0010F7D47F|nr:helix-turn-helix transcriptional regulator [Enterococcus nangangensis]
MPEQLSIAAWREEKGITQEALAQKLGVSEKAVSEWENKKVSVKPMHIFAIAYVLKVDADRIRI